MKFSIPIVFRIKADTVEEAEAIAMTFAGDGVSHVYGTNRDMHDALKYFGPAQIMIRARGDK